MEGGLALQSTFFTCCRCNIYIISMGNFSTANVFDD